MQTRGRPPVSRTGPPQGDHQDLLLNKQDYGLEAGCPIEKRNRKAKPKQLTPGLLDFCQSEPLQTLMVRSRTTFDEVTHRRLDRGIRPDCVGSLHPCVTHRPLQ